MKRILIIIVAAMVGIMSLSSCATMLPSRFEAFSEGVENNAENYNLRKWERKNEKFERLCAEYRDNYSLYTLAERRKIDNSIVKYVKTAARSGVVTITNAVSGVIEQFQSIVSDAKALWEELGFKKK